MSNTPKTYVYFELEVALIETTKDDGSKNKFYAYKTFQKNGKKIDLRFTQEVTNAPKEKCVIKVDIEKFNVDNNRKYPLIWVKGIEEIKPIEKRIKSDKEYANATQMFYNSTDEDLPF